MILGKLFAHMKNLVPAEPKGLCLNILSMVTALEELCCYCQMGTVAQAVP